MYIKQFQHGKTSSQRMTSTKNYLDGKQVKVKLKCYDRAEIVLSEILAYL